ncbi:PREDICTED: uncharacterized protein LOC101634960 [Condylura cristata]|uniref:uncharacterized protein LOC101634960 n=1 Tax=Condylura cristata TaxID=143302 RepID=UPI0006438392|nr:PREDICTED: uncharacterized protein LOC101634960 [Condylura cristata]
MGRIQGVRGQLQGAGQSERLPSDPHSAYTASPRVQTNTEPPVAPVQTPTEPRAPHAPGVSALRDSGRADPTGNPADADSSSPPRADPALQERVRSWMPLTGLFVYRDLVGPSREVSGSFHRGLNFPAGPGRGVGPYPPVNGLQRALCTQQGPQEGAEDAPLTPREPRLRLILVGRSGAGKSATGNSILRQRCFEPRLGGCAVTTACRVGKGRWGRWHLDVVDTPDLFGADVPPSDPRWLERGRCFLLSVPGPHALVLVCRLGRFTPQEQQAWRRVKAMFGPGAAARTVVVFTHKEVLEGGSLLQYVRRNGPRALQELLAECGERACALDYGAAGAEQEAQRQGLLALLEGLVEPHEDEPHTNSVYLVAANAGLATPEKHLHRVALRVAEHMKSPWERCLAAGPWPWRTLFWAGWLGLLILLNVLIYWVFESRRGPSMRPGAAEGDRSWGGRSLLVVGTAPVHETKALTREPVQDTGDCYLLSPQPAAGHPARPLHRGAVGARGLGRSREHVVALFPRKEDPGKPSDVRTSKFVAWCHEITFVSEEPQAGADPCTKHPEAGRNRDWGPPGPRAWTGPQEVSSLLSPPPLVSGVQPVEQNRTSSLELPPSESSKARGAQHPPPARGKGGRTAPPAAAGCPHLPLRGAAPLWQPRRRPECPKPARDPAQRLQPSPSWESKSPP